MLDINLFFIGVMVKVEIICDVIVYRMNLIGLYVYWGEGGWVWGSIGVLGRLVFIDINEFVCWYLLLYIFSLGGLEVWCSGNRGYSMKLFGLIIEFDYNF